MRSAVVVEADPVSGDPRRMLDALEAVAVNALLLERPDDALDHAVLLGTVRRDELLFQAVASDQRREVAAGEDQTVVGPQQERRFDAAERADLAMSACSRAAPAKPSLLCRSRCGRYPWTSARSGLWRQMERLGCGAACRRPASGLASP